MGILERLSTLVRANINAMLDTAEDPEMMLNQILRDMEVEIGKARTQVAEMMAQERLFRDDLEAERNKASHMESRAEQYVRSGNDTMAREALKRKADSDSNIEVLDRQLSAHSEMTNRLRSQLDALVDKHRQALSNRDNLLARYRRSKAQEHVTRTMRDLDVTDYTGDLSRMEQRIRMAEAKAGAEAELQTGVGDDDMGSVFDDAEREGKVDSELAALKARLGMGGNGGSSDGERGSRGDTVNLGGGSQGGSQG